MTPRPQQGPGYWRYEVSGKLAEAMMRFIQGEPLTLINLAVIHVYLKQWVDAPAWDQNPFLNENGRADLWALRRQANEARTEPAMRRLIERLVELGMDPL